MLLLIASLALVILLLYAAYMVRGDLFHDPNIALSAINMLYVAIVIWADADSLQCSLLLSGRMQSLTLCNVTIFIRLLFSSTT